MRRRILILAALVCGTELACMASFRASLFAPFRLPIALGTLGSLSATPGTLSFQASNPDAAMVAGSSPGSLTWRLLSGSHLQNWTLSVQAGSSSFAGCPTIPVSAVQVSCSTAHVSGGGGTGACGGSFPLSTTLQQSAGGLEGDGTNSYSISMNFTLAESWRYIANPSCTISITYTVNAP
jgi:hypothetical protein